MVVVLTPMREDSVVVDVGEALVSEVAPADLHLLNATPSTDREVAANADDEATTKEDIGSSQSFLDGDWGSSTCTDSTSSMVDLGDQTSDDSSLSLSSEGAPMCRICFFGGRKRPLVQPCNCRGTIGYVHKDCLESWIERTAAGRCQICHYQFTVRKKAKATWRLLGDSKARCHVLGYLILGTLVSASIAFVFSLAWLYALRLAGRVGDHIAAPVIVLLVVHNVFWHYFPFLCFMHAFDALKAWHLKNMSLKLVMRKSARRGSIWWILFGPRSPLWSSGTVTTTSLVA